MFIKITKILKSLPKIFVFAIAVIFCSVLANVAFSAWSGPISTAPDDNAPGIILSGASSSYLGNTAVSQYLIFEESVSYPNNFYINSKKGLQFRIDSDNNESSNFTINNGANAEILKLEESGLITVQGKITGASNPVNGTDATTKAYVDQIISALP